MSHLRNIMQKLAAAHPAATPAPSAAMALPQVEVYSGQLQRCSQAMLLYEWSWLHQHLEDLQLCQSNRAMARAAGGSQHVNQLLLQTEGCLQALKAECQARNLQPQRQAHSVASGEHAWEVSNAAIRQAWGLDG
jgi:exonuclease VII large subunit